MDASAGDNILQDDGIVNSFQILADVFWTLQLQGIGKGAVVDVILIEPAHAAACRMR